MLVSLTIKITANTFILHISYNFFLIIDWIAFHNVFPQIKIID